MYDASGTENLRASEQKFGPSTHDTPSMSGPDAGGLENQRANLTTKTGETKKTPKGSSDIPALTFNDDAV